MLKKNALLHLIKAVVSVSLITIIIMNIDWHLFSANLSELNYFFLFLALFLTIIERVELTYKWNLLLGIRGIVVSFYRLLAINLIGSFLGLFIPSSLGTDLVRGYYLIQNNSEKTASISSVIVDRILGVLALFFLAALSVIFSSEKLPNNISSFVILGFILLMIIIYFFQKRQSILLLNPFLKYIRFAKLTRIIVDLHYSILEYKKHPGTLLYSFLVTLLVQITRVLTFYFIALSFNVTVPIFYFFLFVPIVMLIMMLPVSIGGIGVGEGAFIAFFTVVGISLNHSILMAFTSSIFNTFFTLLGGIAYLFYKKPQKQELNLRNNAKVTAPREA